ncbi:hypothetical protein CQA70_29930, partial [Klebsiella pneumoniae]
HAAYAPAIGYRPAAVAAAERARKLERIEPKRTGWTHAAYAPAIGYRPAAVAAAERARKLERIEPKRT